MRRRRRDVPYLTRSSQQLSHLVLLRRVDSQLTVAEVTRPYDPRRGAVTRYLQSSQAEHQAPLARQAHRAILSDSSVYQSMRGQEQMAGASETMLEQPVELSEVQV